MTGINGILTGIRERSLLCDNRGAESPMRCVSLLAVAAALAGCGSHSPAPIVYGTAPTTTGRIYNSPQDYDRVEKPERVTLLPQPAPRLSRPILGESAPTALTPIEATYELDDLQPAPTYVSLATTAAEAREGWITVGPGDTVYGISRRTGASPQAIIAENRIAPPYTLKIGDTLRIPERGRKIENRIEPAPPPVRPAYLGPGDTIRTVRRGDTLYSISRSTGVSVEALAQANQLRRPYTLEIGDTLTIPAASGKRSAPPRSAARATADVGEIARNVAYTPPEPPKREAKLFEWPLKGRIIGEYGSGAGGRRNDGVNIAAPVGTPVRAAADGEVVYRGSELDGYGNLLLVKHQDGFVTAYAHNDVILVQKGQPVRQGQIIAKVGQTGSAQEPQLHFEIRQNLKAIDPAALLDN
jgi:murein DD-endopeptidase MepM/ murein hydrolase activator NlpD